MKSLWEETVQMPRRKSAEGMYERQVVVIGGGITGILTAWQLQRAGKQVAVLEAGRMTGGQTGHTTAKITSQHGLLYQHLIESVGFENARLYAEANQRAIEEYANIVSEKNIDCDFRRLPSYLYSTKEEKLLKREAKAAAALGLPVEFVRETELPFEIAGAVKYREQAQFHPLKFLRVLAGEIEIFENSPVKKVDGTLVCTDRAMFMAEQVVFATHYPIRDVPGFYFLRQHQERSYVVAVKGCHPLQGMYYSADKDGLSFRREGDVILLGGNAHRTGKNFRGGAYGSLKAAACKYFPGSEVAYCWSAQDCMSHDEIPFIGRYSMLRKDWYVATGFNKWGMTSSMVAALLLTDLIMGRKNSWEKLFTPQRLRPRAARLNFWKDVGESVIGLSRGFVEAVVNAGAEGEKTCTRCTHLGCKLHWNPDEKSWDCPCHGSRFDEKGKRIDEPAQKDIDTVSR